MYVCMFKTCNVYDVFLMNICGMSVNGNSQHVLSFIAMVKLNSYTCTHQFIAYVYVYTNLCMYHVTHVHITVEIQSYVTF